MVEMVFFGCVVLCGMMAVLIVMGHGAWLIAHVSWVFLTFVCICLWSVLFGMWRSISLIQRIVTIQEAMNLLEKGQFPRELHVKGDDEIGCLAQQTMRLARMWEEQVARLQRLVTDNARLAKTEQMSAMISERQRIARDLHDAVSQQLFAMVLSATALSRNATDEQMQKQSVQIAEMATLAQSEMRALLLQLRPVPLTDQRFVDALDHLLVALKNSITTHITWEIDHTIELAQGIEDHLFRIVQEAISNITRHAHARNVMVRFRRNPTGVRLMVRDDGIGFDSKNIKMMSYGLLSMQERVNEIGGSVQIVSFPQNGTKIDVHVPITLPPTIQVQEKEKEGGDNE